MPPRSRLIFSSRQLGNGLIDFDNDGDRDLFIACGNLTRLSTSTIGRAALPNYLLLNTGNGKYVDVTHRSGDGLAVVESSRGTAFDDLDNDGDIDAAVLNANAPPTILRKKRDGQSLAAGLPAGQDQSRRVGAGCVSLLAILSRSPKCTAGAVTKATQEPGCISARASGIAWTHRGSLARRGYRHLSRRGGGPEDHPPRADCRCAQSVAAASGKALKGVATFPITTRCQGRCRGFGWEKDVHFRWATIVRNYCGNPVYFFVKKSLYSGSRPVTK